mgnify:CR=1 FL=1|jgi:hypothetical protein|tara:strand:+ start:197 stop:475 length:279 start_codon:yes stop_codon:yes gene_type:complete
MAKTKEKVVDLKPTHVSDDHLKKIQETVSEINKTYLELGRIAANQHAYLHSLTGKQSELNVLQEELNKEYGTNDIDINDGTINYPKENGKVN